jgi:hypothetical protein
MKRNDFVSCAIASLAASLCLSGQAVREVQGDMPTTVETSRAEQEQAAPEKKSEERRGAARRVVEGSPVLPRKSAAQVAMEDEMTRQE